MKKSLHRSIMMTILMFILLGGLYPLVVTLAGKLFFPQQSSGGLIVRDQQIVGAKLIGQSFVTKKYFHGRPSAAGDKGYDATNSSASNLAPTNKALQDRMETSIQQVLKENPTLRREDIPVDLVTASGSGLDPEISEEAAFVQIPRIAQARKIDEDKIKLIVKNYYVEKPSLGFIGTTRVNVLLLNLALDDIK